MEEVDTKEYHQKVWKDWTDKNNRLSELHKKKDSALTKEEIMEFESLEYDMNSDANSMFIARGFVWGYEKKEKEVLELIDKFSGEEYTDYEIWEDIKKELKQKIEG